EELNLIIFRRY
ncbi:L-ribulose-5-phosphate 4-epimerase SgbE, partial [Haemophilus influenzae]